ncbi:HAD-IIA family hydrolase [Kitasatospora sp. NPDC051914]|uniref:HAD-IIA family hydrolase n=1 Tax=Kitasatospora sp. NPDC051914 TaxID=3154945 RepID=UPI00341D6BC8
MRHRTTTTVSAALIDIDGVLTVSWKPIPGAVEALERLREMGLPFLLLTNTTSRTRASIATTLAGAGFPVSAESVLTAPSATAAFLAEHHPGARCLLLNSGDVRQDLTGVALAEDDEATEGEDVDVVLVGGAGPEFDYRALNRAFGHLQRGARLVAMHRNLYWRTDRGLQLDGGAFLAGLEQASGQRAEVVGKPAPAFFAGALTLLGAEADRTLMVGDDIESDVLAAQRCGISGVLVKTGKFQDRALRDTDGTPDHVLDSVADLPVLVAQLA